MRDAGLFSDFMPSCMNGFVWTGGCAAGVGGFSESCGVELSAGVAVGVAVGVVDGGREVPLPLDGPPSFASRFARIYTKSARVLQMGLGDGTLSASDMASGMGRSFSGCGGWSAMVSGNERLCTVV
jgi:hypothetical protein